MSSTIDLLRDDTIRKRLAKHLVLQCVRNTYLEDLHAGVGPDSLTGDYSDVRVISPAGEIAWKDLSRLSDQEMRKLMIEVVNKVHEYLTAISSGDFDHVLETLAGTDPLPQWFDPPHDQATDH